MKFIDPDNLPEGESMVIIGSNSPTGIEEAEKECSKCHGQMWVSLKNANRDNARYMCSTCAFSDSEVMESLEKDGPVSTRKDIQEFLDHEGIDDVDVDQVVPFLHILIEQEMRKYKKKKEDHD